VPVAAHRQRGRMAVVLALPIGRAQKWAVPTETQLPRFEKTRARRLYLPRGSYNHVNKAVKFLNSGEVKILKS